ncbi:MAG: hypothetical protein R3F41_14220 [Gammaproteobacteria bacterium]
MNFEKLNQSLSILANLGVLGGLLFVGMQLLLDRNVAVGEQYQLRAQTALENVRAEFDNERYIESLAAGWENGRRPQWWSSELENLWVGMAKIGLDPTDLYRIYRRIQMSYLQIDNLHYQFEKGLLEKENWPPFRNQLKQMLQDPLSRATILSNSTMRPDFRNLLDELMQEIGQEN